MHEIRRRGRTDGCHCAHMHQRSAVAVEHKHTLLRTMEGNAERNRTRMPHRADGEKVMCVILAAPLAQLKELAPRLARGGDDDGVSCRIEDARDHIFTAQGICIPVFPLRVFQCSFADKEGALPARCEMRALLLYPGSGICQCRRVREHHRLYAHRLEQRQTQPSLHEMLRLIMEIRLAAPADNEDAGDAVDLLMQEREQRVHDVAEPAVLQIDERRLARREMIARRKRRGAALVRGEDMRRPVTPVGIHEIIHERAQLRVRHASEKVHAERSDEFVDVHSILL